MCIEPALLDKTVWDKLKEHPDLFQEWLGVIAPEFIPKINDFFKENVSARAPETYHHSANEYFFIFKEIATSIAPARK